MGGVLNNDLETIQKRVQLKVFFNKEVTLLPLTLLACQDNILSAVSKNRSPGNLVKRKPDYSVYRTPSGNISCRPTHC